MIERLITTLRMLAAPADVQRDRLPPLAPHADELARDFEDAYRLVCDCPQVELTPAQRAALGRVEARLDMLRGDGEAALWTEPALRSAPEWAETRRAAAEALVALGAMGAADGRDQAGSGRAR